MQNKREMHDEQSNTALTIKLRNWRIANLKERGRVDGHDLDDWLLGERELRQALPNFEGMLFGLYERRTR